MKDVLRKQVRAQHFMFSEKKSVSHFNEGLSCQEDGDLGLNLFCEAANSKCDVKCWRGCVYCLSQQRPSYRKINKRIISHPVSCCETVQVRACLLLRANPWKKLSD